MPFKSLAQSRWTFMAKKPWTKKFTIESNFRRAPGRVHVKTRFASGRRRSVARYRRR